MQKIIKQCKGSSSINLGCVCLKFNCIFIPTNFIQILKILEGFLMKQRTVTKQKLNVKGHPVLTKEWYS